MIRGFKKIRSDNKDLMRVQDNCDEVLSPLAALPLLDGHILQDVAFAAGVEKQVEHLLGRKIRGYITVRAEVDTSGGTARVVLNEALTQPMPDKLITLVCDYDTVASIYVF